MGVSRQTHEQCCTRLPVSGCESTNTRTMVHNKHLWPKVRVCVWEATAAYPKESNHSSNCDCGESLANCHSKPQHLHEECGGGGGGARARARVCVSFCVCAWFFSWFFMCGTHIFLWGNKEFLDLAWLDPHVLCVILNSFFSLLKFIYICVLPII